MTTITFAIDRPGGAPRSYGTVLVTLVAGPAGGSTTGGVVADIERVRLDHQGEGSIDLVPNDGISPAGSYYRCTVEGSSPTVVRTFAIPSDAEGPIPWDDPSIAVVEAPVGTRWVPSPVGQPDGHALLVAGEQLIYGPAPGGEPYDDTIPAESLGFLDPVNLGDTVRFWAIALMGGNPTAPYPYGLSTDAADTVDAIVSGTAGFVAGVMEPPLDQPAAVRNTDATVPIILALAAVTNATVQGIQFGTLPGLEAGISSLNGTVSGLSSSLSSLGSRVDDLEDVPAPAASIASLDPIVVDVDGPVMAVAGTGDWDDAGLREPGNTLWDEATEQWVTCYTGASSTATPFEANIGLALSGDGETWTQHPDNPVTGSTGGEDPYLAKTLDGRVWRDSAGRALLFTEEKNSGADQRGIQLWRSATGTLDDWTLVGRVIDRGTALDWDDRDRTSPVVFWAGTQLVCLFEGRSNAGNQGEIGLAYSVDEGETWTVEPDPIITRGPAGSWYDTAIVPDDVHRIGATWVLTVHAQGNGSPYYAGRFATADRPANWEPGSFAELPGNPFRTDSPDVMGVGNDSTLAACLAWDEDLEAFGTWQLATIRRTTPEETP